MILISHRGNINGPNMEFENNPDYIKTAINLGFNVEIDVWEIDNEYFLGHDFPKYKVNEFFLENTDIWCHAKNLESLEKMIKNKKIHCFWHQNDDFTITSNGFIWTYPNKKLTDISICVNLNHYDSVLHKSNISGICSDYIKKYKND